MGIVNPNSDPVDSLGGLGDMLVESLICKGISLVNNDGFPTLHSPISDPGKGSNRKIRGSREIKAPEGSGKHAEEKDVAGIC